MSQPAPFSIDPDDVLTKKIGRPDICPQTLSNVKNSVRRYLAFRQVGETENKMPKRWFVRSCSFSSDHNIEAATQQRMTFCE